MARFLALAMGLGGVACGPSVRMVHQSNSYFETCHAADFDPSVRISDKRACWAAWLEHYTDGQPPDRVAYALERLEDLDRGRTLRALPGIRTTMVGTAYTGSTLPSAESGPAEVESRHDANGERPESPSERPISACDRACAPRVERCLSHCRDHANGCRQACEVEERLCSRGCFP
jgi:hypothetical protein